MNCSYNPTYIVQQNPSRFGGKQPDYLARANRVIDQAATRIRMVKSAGGDLVKLFFEIIATLSRERGQIARDHGTEEARNFGRRRDQARPHAIYALPVEGYYKKYGEQMLTRLHDRVQAMELKETPGKFKKKECIPDGCPNRQFRWDIEVLDNQDFVARGWSFQDKRPLPFHVSQALTEAEAFLPDESEPPETLKKLKNVFKKWKTEQPELYQIMTTRLALGKFIEIEGKKSEPLNSIWIHATARGEINGKLYGLTRYLCRMNANEPLNRMITHSKIMLIQQDVHLIEETLQEIAEIFACTVTWEKDKDIPQELKSRMALLMFLASHNMRDIRGTAAENEWLESAIYRSLDMPFSKDESCMVDLEAFANPLFSDFAKRYDRIVTFKKEP